MESDSASDPQTNCDGGASATEMEEDVKISELGDNGVLEASTQRLSVMDAKQMRVSSCSSPLQRERTKSTCC